MPIKPENRARYPANWPVISRTCRERARWRCQHPGCKATQYSVGYWVQEVAGPWLWCPVQGNTPATTAQDREFWWAGEGRDAAGQEWTYGKARAFIARWCWPDDDPVVIVLTVAHLDHTPENCEPNNLAALCQRHHLAYDATHHATTAYMSRRAARNNLELPL